MQLLSAAGDGARPPVRVACTCPTCGADTYLIYLGEQQWPSQVAQKMGISPTVQLWKCESCQTTLSQSQDKTPDN